MTRRETGRRPEGLPDTTRSVIPGAGPVMSLVARGEGVAALENSGALGVYNAVSGAFMRRVTPVGWTSDVMLAPWDGKARP